ncbi:MAG: hypothetical protein K6D98_03925 [Clostridiales bacterium]|nr:hypothetical protein [Clostridiales bacterium]
MDIKEKVSHLMGLIEGMEYDLTTKEGRIIAEIMDILSDMADEIAVINEDVDTLYDYADELDEDLGAVESELYGDCCCDEDDECADCDEYDNCDGENCIKFSDDEE